MTDPNWSCLVLVNTQEVLSRHLATVLCCAVLEWRYRNQSRTEFCSLEISKSPWMQCWALCSGCPWWGRVEPEGPWSASKLNHLVVLWFSAFNPGFPAGWVCSIALSTHCGGGLGVLQLVVTYGGITVTLQHLLRRHIHRLKTCHLSQEILGGINISAGLSDELCQTVVFFQALETSSRFTSFRHLPGCKKYVDVALRDMA